MASDGPDRLLSDADTYTKVVFCFFGLYVWELFQTAHIDFDLVRRARWRQPTLAVGYACKLTTLVAFICMIVSSTNHARLACKPLSVAAAALTTTSSLLALGLVMTSTIQLTQKRSLLLPLGCLLLFTTAFRYLYVFSSFDAVWNPLVGCVPVPVHGSPHTLAHLSVFFTLSDYVVLLACMLPNSRKRAKPLLGQTVVDDRLLVYIALVFLNVPPAVLDVLDINLIINQVATPPALALTAVLALRLTHSTIELPLLGGSPSADLFAHSSVVLSPTGTRQGTAAGASRASKLTFSTSRASREGKSTRSKPGVPSLHVTTADLAAEPFPMASPPAFPEEIGVPDWAPAGTMRLSMDSARISPIHFADTGETDVHYAHA